MLKVLAHIHDWFDKQCRTKHAVLVDRLEPIPLFVMRLPSTPDLPITQRHHSACMLARLTGIASLHLRGSGPAHNQPILQLPKELP